ncbi:MAG: GNAT family N-acetyltransferase, partial [Propionibacteriaceae bacterium]|nr:GNAT family N-acetyltransferase [Propionibacteriaceae bacterium]
ELGMGSGAWVIGVSKGTELVAAVPLYHIEEEPNDAYHIQEVLGFSRPATHPLLVGNHRGYESGVVYNPDYPEALPLLIDAIRIETERVGTDVAWWPYLTEAAVILLHPHCPGLLGLLDISADYLLPAGDFSAFLLGLTRAQRGKIRRDRRLFEDSGLMVYRGVPEPFLPDIAHLVAEVESHHNNLMDPASLLPWLEAQLLVIGDQALAVVSRNHDNPVACALLYRSENQVVVRMAGLDYQRTGTAGEYFETTLYQGIEWALDQGIRQLSLGTGTLQAKSYRGARLSPRWALQVAGTPLVDHIGNNTRLDKICKRERVPSSSVESVLVNVG